MILESAVVYIILAVTFMSMMTVCKFLTAAVNGIKHATDGSVCCPASEFSFPCKAKDIEALKPAILHTLDFIPAVNSK